MEAYLKWKRLLALIPALLMLAGLCACGGKEASLKKPPEEIAEDFSRAFKEKWDTVEGAHEMLNGDGKGFLADLDGDGLGELCFLYDNYRISTAVVYRLSGEKIEELGSFDASEFYHQDLTFEIYNGDEGALLHAESVMRGGAADPASGVTDSYVSVKGEGLEVRTLYRIDLEGGESTYYNTPYDGIVISEAQNAKRLQELLDGRTLSETITLPAEELVEDFIEGDRLEKYILSLLENRAHAPNTKSTQNFFKGVHF